MKQITTGSKAPNFTLKDQDGRTFELYQALHSGPIVLYFYPKNETYGCTKEACAFRDKFEDFVEAGAQVVGISADSVDSHRLFIANRKLPFTLLSDPDRAVHHLFGLRVGILGFLSRRVTYVIDGQGIVRKIFDSLIDFDGHVNESLNYLKGIG